MVKTLAELRTECIAIGIEVETSGRENKEPYLAALRNHHWQKDHPGLPIPEQIEPMLLGNWDDLSPEDANSLENDHHAWCVQPKLDGMRVLVHVGDEGIRITGRNISEVNYRLTEHQANVPHLIEAFQDFGEHVFDGELICPIHHVHTGAQATQNALQAAVAILATTPQNAYEIQARHNSWLELQLFDLIRAGAQDITALPLYERLRLLTAAIRKLQNPFVRLVPTGIVGKRAIHEQVLQAGGEGTVWKRLDQPYEPGRRVRHWLKRKRSTEMEAFVSNFKPGTQGRGHDGLIGAVEFSTLAADGSMRPIAWVCGWSDEERLAMSTTDENGRLRIHPGYLGRKAIVIGQDESARSRRLRHARLKHWVS